MPHIEWNESLALGIKSIDEQHQYLVALFNALADDSSAQGDTCPVETLVAKLKDYAAEHFHIEEGYMQAFAYPDTAAHVKEHESFIAALTSFEAACSEGTGDTQAVLAYLQGWLGEHLTGVDRKMGRFLEDYLS